MQEIVAPFVGAWIEIDNGSYKVDRRKVAPFVGAWIEILHALPASAATTSLLSWERGLKLLKNKTFKLQKRSLLSWERGLKSAGGVM